MIKPKTFWLMLLFLCCAVYALAQEPEIDITLDANSATIPLPKIFKPDIDLSGRGFSVDAAWPQGMASKATIEDWQKDVGFSGMYRLQYNLWEINALSKDKDMYAQILANYEGVIKAVNDAQGVVILDIFSTPAGLGKALDKKSAPWDLKAFKAIVKQTIEDLSCAKKYNIWYEVWSAPDMDDFYLGRKQEYLSLYRTVAEAVLELEQEYKIHIPVGGPSTSWWFQNLDGNSVITPERSLIYELIKFCYDQRLPLSFISWHAYSTDPKIEKESTPYNKTAVALIRDWLSYFRFEPDTPLIVDEWNYDSGANMLSERKENSNICASYLASRIKQMYEAGIDYQTFYSMEDFQNNKENVARNVGVFWFDNQAEYKRGPKSVYNVFKMLAGLGKDMFTGVKVNDEFVDMVATKGSDYVALIISDYIDPDIAMNFISRNMASLNDSERKVTINLIKTGKLKKVISGDLNINTMRVTKKLKALFKKAQDLNINYAKFSKTDRNIKINIKNLKGDYAYQRFTVDSGCSLNCDFTAVDDKTVQADTFQEGFVLKPYSVNMVVLKKKPKEEVVAPESPAAVTAPIEAGTTPEKQN